MAPVTLGLVVYGLKTDHPRGRTATAIALALSIVAILLSGAVWRLAITGRGTDGEKVNVWDDTTVVGFLFVEAAVFAAALAGHLRRSRRRPLPPSP